MVSAHKSKFVISVIFALSIILVRGAEAATLTLVPEKKTIKIGEEVSVNFKVDTGDESINAVQTTMQFPTAVFEVTKIDKADSVFNFWIEEPTFSNETGEAKFMGGTPKGISGKSLQILTLTFKARGSGSGEIALSDAVITASDGKGTNILSRAEGITLTVGTEILIPSSLPAGTPTSAQAPIQPQKVERTAIPASKLPMAPIVKVPLYPDTTNWYNHLGETIALWGVPDDITMVATVLNQNPNTVPTVAEKELSTGKNFGTITKEGVWYVHIRFRNNIGWGSTAHYKISLDTTPPLPFEVKIDNVASDNPTPYITFNAQDAFSGVSHTLLFVDGKKVGETSTTTALLPVHAPGIHELLVKVFDRAGSSMEDGLQFEILPLPTPAIEFISKSVSQGEVMFASGIAIPNAFVDVRATNSLQQEVFTGVTQSDGSGNWKITIDKALPTGKYGLLVRARDERGALSVASSESFFNIRPKIILSLGRFINLGWFEIFIIAMLIIISGASVIAWWYVAKKKTHEAYKIIIGRDLEKLGTLLSSNLKELESLQEVHDLNSSTQAIACVERMKETISKMKKYIGEEVKKLT